MRFVQCVKYAVFLLMVSGNVSFAQTRGQDVSDLMAMDLSDLMVSVASKKVERVNDAPSVLNVVTAQDIEAYGANTLMDVLQRLPNVYTIGSNVFRDNAVSIRGQTLSHIDNHVLILLNGRPMRETFTGGINNAIYNSFPLRLVKRIEMIRGPGSVLYGSNAFSGAINIVTKTQDDFNGLLITQGVGSKQSYDTEAVFATSLDQTSIIGAARYYNSQGWDFAATDALGVYQNNDYSRDIQSGFFQVNRNKIKITGYSGALDEDTIGFATQYPIDPAYTRRRFLDLQYKTDTGLGDWDVTLNTTYNGYDGVIGVSGPPTDISTRNVDDLLIEGSATGSITNKTDLLIGGVFEHHNIDLNGQRFDDKFVSTGYAQIDYRPQDWIRLIAGGQLNQVTGTRRDFSPRIGGVFNLDNNWGLKILHARAYRSPQAIERKTLTPALLGNADLKAESIRTTDIQLNYTNRTTKAAITYYQSRQKNTIIRTPAGGAFQFNNGGTVDYEGMEIEAKYAPHAMPWSFVGSLSWQSGEDEGGNDDIGLVPHYMAKLGIHYHPADRGYQFGVFNSFYSRPTDISDAFPSVNIVNPKSKPSHLITANASVHVPTVFENTALPNLTLSLYADNILDEDFDFPQYTSPRVNSLPLRAGRTIFARATVQF